MSSIVKSAVSGKRASMISLYEENKQKAYYIAYRLLSDQTEAQKAVCLTFKDIWQQTEKNGVKDEKDFSALVLDNVIKNCKKTTLRKYSQAFKVPNNKNFNITQISETNTKPDDAVNGVLDHFSQLQRYIFVLHTVAGYDGNKIANVVKTDVKTVESAILAESQNVQRITELTGKDSFSSYEDFVSSVKNGEDISLPAAIQENVYKSIAAYAEPFEKRKKSNCKKAGIAVALVAVIVALAIIIMNLPSKSDNNSDNSNNNSSITGGTWVSDVEPTHYAVIDIKDYGKITLELDANTAPITVENFVSLAKDGFYDGLTFHRIIENFMMQGGAASDVSKTPETIKGEFNDNNVKNYLSHTRGAISMARANDYNSASSQFFIVHEDSPRLNGQYAAFGYVVDGIEVVDAVCEDAKPSDGNGSIPKSKQPIINYVKVYEKDEFTFVTDAETEAVTNEETAEETTEDTSTDTSKDTVADTEN